MIKILPSKPGFNSLCGHSLYLWITFDLAHRQQIFMDSTKQGTWPLACDCLREALEGMEGWRGVEARYLFPRSLRWVKVGSDSSRARSPASSSSSSSWNRSLLLLLWARFCIASSPEMLLKLQWHPLTLPWALETVSPLVMRRSVPLQEVTNRSPCGFCQEAAERQFHEMLRKSTQFPQPTLKKLALHQPRIYLGSWKYFAFRDDSL